MFLVSVLISIIRSAIADSPLQCWDNISRGLDSATSATALDFARTLSTSTELTEATANGIFLFSVEQWNKMADDCL